MVLRLDFTVFIRNLQRYNSIIFSTNSGTFQVIFKVKTKFKHFSRRTLNSSIFKFAILYKSCPNIQPDIPQIGSEEKESENVTN